MSQSPDPTRRAFLRRAAYGLAAAPFISLFGCTSGTPSRGASSMIADNDDILDLLPGLASTILDRTGRPLSDGYVSPARPDGMACFEDAAGRWILMRNHEIDQGHIGTPSGVGGYELGAAPAGAYTDDALGGVSRLVVDPATLSLIESNMVLSGTRKNCAGGSTPMGWLSCEETIDEDGQNHGYVFLCDPAATSLQPAQRIDAYGRFIHEAAGFDPSTGICYLTEDRNEACLYRFVPLRPDRPFEGKLQALRVTGRPKFATSSLGVGQTVSVDWIDVADPLAGLDLPAQCHERGAATIARGEGCWFDDDRLVFAATSGGPVGAGQIFELRDGPDSGTLTVLAEATEAQAISAPDNVVIAPDGSIYFAEDNGTDCLIQRLTVDGIVEPIARNREQGEEIAGLCFSPDGSVLFANIQEPGITVAITGL